jgi:transposase
LSNRVDPDALTDEQWARLAPLMPGGCKGKRGPRTNNRLFLDALIWMTRSGGRWKDLPERFGKVGTVKRRYYDWMARGVLAEILAALAQEADLEWICVDATIVRAHSQAAGASREKGALMPRAWVAPEAA